MKIIAWISVVIIAFVLGPIWGGYVLSVLWRWFIMSNFDLPALRVPNAIGLAMVVGYLTHQTSPDTDEEKKKSFQDRMIEAITLALSKPLFALVFGWVVYQFIHH